MTKGDIMAKWKIGDILILKGKYPDDAIKILNTGDNQYMISPVYAMIRKIIPTQEIDSKPYKLYTGDINVNKNSKTNYRKSSSKKRRNETSSNLSEKGSTQCNRRTIRNSKSNVRCASIHRKSQACGWRKKQTKSKRDTR
jgi:hypothetical protein